MRRRSAARTQRIRLREIVACLLLQKERQQQQRKAVDCFLFAEIRKY
jgi:hypothetical protein